MKNNCPILSAALLSTPRWTIDSPNTDCLMCECAWWNTKFEMCCIAVDAYLKGIEENRREHAILTKDVP